MILLGWAGALCHEQMSWSSESSLCIHCSVLPFPPECDENELGFIKWLKRHQGGKKTPPYEWDGNNNKVRTEPDIGEGNLVWFASNRLNAVND